MSDGLEGQRTPNAFEILCLKLYGDLAKNRIEHHPDLAGKLSKAGEYLVPSAFLAAIYGRVTVAALLGLTLFIFVAVVGGAAGALSTVWFIAVALLPVFFAIVAWSYEMIRPDIAIKARRLNLEANLPYALNFMAAMASAGVVPDQIFAALSKQKVYGEVAVEAQRIYRDTRLFGKDLLRSMSDAAQRSPSPQFDEFLQGAVNTITSGGNLKQYLLSRSEQFTEEGRRRMKNFLESLGVMAESYVVVAAATPLFLIVILSVMAFISDAEQMMTWMTMFVMLVLPVMHGTFTWVLRSMRAE